MDDSYVSVAFEYRKLHDITDGFSEDRKIGSGGYGVVYKGLHDGKEIAVKKLRPLVGLNDEPFDKEFDTLSKIHHENVVHLIGYCYESRRNYIKHNHETITAIERERILCFEYMKGGSLDKHITDETCVLDWPICYKIIRGTSDGLNHLHNSQDRPIFHLDLKPSNILLDENWTPKISDLGLSRIVATTKTHRTERFNMQGTIGYMPPEYIDSADISKKFDVFSLGSIIIRILDGMAFNSRYSYMDSQQFIKHVIVNWEKRLQGSSRYKSHEKDTIQVNRCLEIALRCVEKDRNKRPSIKDIVNELEELEAQIQKMSLRSDQPKDPIGEISSGTSLVAVDPRELRFLFEPRKDISTCLQLTNLTDRFTGFQIKTNPAKYYTQPNKGIMPPCSECYICVTLREQDGALQKMQCNDIILVHSANVCEGLKINEITDDLFKEGKVVDMVKLPIVYIAMDQFQSPDV
uniref:Uncharacterized protein n=1 Tax=Avena sativa TaxID=4498 RepID=A0ACD5TQQ6_AVESA